MVAVCVRSSSVCARYLSLLPILTPPTRSELFSVCASALAKALVAPFSDSANTEEPRAARLGAASAWMETNRSAFSLRALATRTPSGMNTSSLRVM
ncbi:Uncharacterised protein [Chromobacterium violaceum]|uniref:Uncharacterized protein n=1 Tax=Chromobacterium violaceum TaxID=536 RepID=A0A447TJM1_CHRVL|nr:Uncharacterised protein [Chromobacterium violaceum]